MLRIWRFAAIYLTALTLSLTLCHLLEMPRKMQYGEGLYMAVQHSLYLFFAWVGAFAEVGAVAWSSVPLPANWTDVRRQWEFGHTASAVLDLVGFGALVLSVVVDTPKSASQAGAASESRKYDAA